ncbi:MAG: hypothetical protein JKY96_02695 [Phycisphaerales bacterium]|nr:hypothetical protein [Phycisphaerales bacterium]
MAERRTSAARDILDAQADNALERYGELADGFKQAKAAEQPLEASQDHSQPSHAPYTSTSAARDIVDAQADNLLEQYGETSQAFNGAHNNEQANDAGQGRESTMVANDQPKPELKPDQDIAKSADRESFNDRWNEERQDAQQQDNDRQTHGR